MSYLKKISAVAAISAGAAMFAMPANAAQGIEWTPKMCKAEWAKVDANGDGQLDAKESAPYSKVMTNVDTDNNGMISADEYTVACKDGVFNDMKKQG